MMAVKELIDPQLRDLQIGDFVEFVHKKPAPKRETIDAGWYIWRAVPNFELQVSIMLNVRGFEAFCPSEYKLQRTNRMENGRRVIETRARAMIPGYFFINDDGRWDSDAVKRVKGVVDFMKIEGKPAGLSDSEVERFKVLSAAEFEKHQRDMARRAAEEADRLAGKPAVPFEQGKQVRIDGPTGEAWIGTMLQQRGNKRVEMLIDNAKIIVPHYRIHNLEPEVCE